MQTKANSDLYPNFKDFVDFMQLISSEACDPVYSSDNLCLNNYSKLKDCNAIASEPCTVKDSSVNLPKWSGTGQSCVVCGKDNRLFYCEDFKSLMPEDCLKVVKKHRLCFNCLLAGHSSKKCRKTSVCSVSGCGKKHTKFIHVDFNDNSRVPRGNFSLADNLSSATVVNNGNVKSDSTSV